MFGLALNQKYLDKLVDWPMAMHHLIENIEHQIARLQSERSCMYGFMPNCMGHGWDEIKYCGNYSIG